MDEQRNNQNEESLLRDEQYALLKSLQIKSKELKQIIAEGEEFLKFKSSNFYSIYTDFLKSLKSFCNDEAHKASRDTRSDISFYLGQESAIKVILSTLPMYETKAADAIAELDSVNQQIEEINSILSQTIEPSTVDTHGAMG